MAAEQHSILYKPVNAVWERAVDAVGLDGRLPEQLPEHVVMSLFVVALCAVIFVPFSRSLKKEDPGYFQQMLEVLFQSLSRMIDEAVGEGASKRFLPLIASFAVFIFLSNLSGGLFFLQPPTQSPWVTFALSITACAYYHVIGVREHGIGYLKQFVGPGPPPIWLWPLMIPIEIVSHLARVFSLGLRLFGNIFGEHVAVGIFAGLIPLLLPLPLMGLGLFASFMQTFIFIMLTTLYIAGAEASEH
jgi:F-type H+-transporting ATPase subunit a